MSADDFDEIERLLDAMLAHQEGSGRFPSYGAVRASDEPVWGALLCDSDAVLEVLHGGTLGGQPPSAATPCR